MLSYRHSFHAGNFADVIKHLVLVELLTYYSRKDTPFSYIDTHAGAGIYDLQSDYSAKNREFEGGIGRLQQAEWPELDAYFRIIGRFNPDRALRFYPGSPKFAEALLRKQDRGWLFELHPSDFAILRHNFAGNRSFIVRKEDGYRTLTALLPPKSRRGIVLIDPPYELKSDYATAVETLIKAHRRFPTGVYALWYPVVERRRIDKMEEVLAASGTKRIQLFELGRSPDAPGPGMTAAGMIVINPPWTLFQKMEDILPRLATAMRAGERSHFRCITLAGE